MSTQYTGIFLSGDIAHSLSKKTGTNGDGGMDFEITVFPSKYKYADVKILYRNNMAEE